MTRATQAVIDLAALRHNLGVVRQYAPTQKIMPVIKANAYGHGMLAIAKALDQADAIAVAIMDEALELRESGLKMPITVLHGASSLEELAQADALNFDLVVHQPQQLVLLAGYQSRRPLTVWLKLDSGMHRMGLLPHEFLSAYQQLRACACVGEIRLMSHFACADDLDSDMTAQQNQKFEDVTAEIDAPRCAANSAAIMAWPQTRHDWVRPGIMLYGVSPLLQPKEAAVPLQPVMTLQSSIVAIKTLNEGESVGYGAAWKATGPTRVALVAIGYGDGYPRCMNPGAPVLLNGQRAPIVGRVSMDSFSVDIGHLAGVHIGDPVVLWGKDLSVSEVAGYANTISYEMLCRVSLRVPRLYVAQ